jgi:cell division septum initiation protein DivIVA
MNEDFIFRIGADVSGFTKSISDVERELKKVQSELKTKTGAAIVETNKYIADLQSSLVNLRTSGLSKLPKAIGDGTASLTALGQVARDAPFGFIAIQNNLPILFDQFTNLSKSAGGVSGAFKSLGAALSGPAGISFAIGALISLVTVAIQKYGSFEGALNAFIGKTITAAEIQNRYNAALEDSKKSSAGEIANLDSLVKILTSANSTREQQIGAFDELNEIYPGLLSNIKKENLNSALSLQLIAERTKLIKNQILLEGRKEALIKLIGESSLEAEKALSKLTTKPDFFSFEELALSLRGVLEGTNPVIARTKVLTKDFANANTATQSFADRLDAVNGELTGVNAQITNLVDTQKKLDAQDKKSAQTAQKNKNAAAAQAKRDAKKNETQRKKNIALSQEQTRVDNLYKIKDRIKEQAALNAIELKGYRERTKERRKGEREAGITLPTQISPIVPSLNNEKLLQDVSYANNQLKRLKKEANLSAAYNLINGTFFGPMEDLFSNFLQTGKFAFKEFAQAILKAISQIVAKVIATGIITLLASLFIPGFSAAGGGLGASLLSGITGALGFGGGGIGGTGRVAAPSFGGISGGPLNMAGAVNLSLRGSDLVGSINRTNATISRVG